jgi:hypothetical protein
MKLDQRVVEHWDDSSAWAGQFRLADYMPIQVWKDDHGARTAEFNEFVRELAEELSALRLRATALQELTEGYLRLFAAFGPSDALLVAGEVHAFLALPLGERPTFLEE